MLKIPFTTTPFKKEKKPFDLGLPKETGFDMPPQIARTTAPVVESPLKFDIKLPFKKPEPMTFPAYPGRVEEVVSQMGRPPGVPVKIPAIPFLPARFQPFTQREFLRPETPVDVMAGRIIEMPEKVVTSLQELPHIIMERDVPEYKGKAYRVPSYAEDASGMIVGLSQMGYSETEAITAAILMTGGQAIIDTTIVARLISGGARMVMPEPSNKIAAWKTLGQPKTMAEAVKSRNALSHQFHPDKVAVTGLDVKVSAKAQAQINDAYAILQKAGMPTKVDFAKMGLEKAVAPFTTPSTPIFQLKKVAGKLKIETTPLKDILKFDIGKAPTPPTLPLRQLPGYAPAPGQPTPFGLSIQNWERVGGVKGELAKELVKKVGKTQAENIIQTKGTQLVSQAGALGVKEAVARIAITPTTPKELEPLAKEARKYKSAEEFVRSQTPIFHRTRAEFDKFDISKKGDRAIGLHFFDSKKTLDDPTFVQRFGDKVIEAYPQGKVADLGVSKLAPELEYVAKLSGEALKTALQSKGYVGFKMGGEIVIFDPKNVLTKSQLTDIYTQAVKGVEPVREVKPEVPVKPEVKIEPKPQLTNEIPEQAIKKAEQIHEIAGRKDVVVQSVSGWEKVKPSLLEEGRKKPDIVPDNIAFRTMRDGTKRPAIRRSGIYAEKEFETHPFLDVGGKADNLTSWAASIDNIQEGTGFGPAYNLAYKLDTETILPRNDFITDTVARIQNIVNETGIRKTKATGEIIFDLLDGKVPKTATVQHKQAAQQIRNTLDELREKANEVRKALGKKEIGYIEDYAPAVQRASIWRDLWGDARTRIEDVFDFIIPNQKVNPHAYKRFDLLKDKEKNIWKLLDGYTQAVSNDIYLTPAIEKFKAVQSVLQGREMYQSAGWLNTFIRTNLVGKPHIIDNQVGLKAGGLPRKLATKVIRARTIGALAANIQWITLTQPMSMGLTVMKAGVPRTAMGAVKWAIDKELRHKIASSPVMRQKDKFGVGRTGAGEMDRAVKNIFRGPIEKFNDVLGRLSDAMEYNLTGMSISAGLETGKKYGLKGLELDMYGDYIGRVTQSQYTPETRAQILNSLAVRAVFPFQTYSFELFRHIKTLAGRPGGLPLGARQRLGHIMNLTIAILAINAIHLKARGRPLQTPGSAIPLVGGFVDQQLGKLTGSLLDTPEQKRVSKLLGIDPEMSWTSTGRAPMAPFEDIKKLVKASTDVIQYGNFDRLRRELVFWASGLAGIGGGAQANRIVDGLISAEKGYVEDVKGKKLFDIEGWDKLWAPIVGPWGLEAARERTPTQTFPAGALQTRQGTMQAREKLPSLRTR